jgi:hypothetical protein
VRQPRCFTCHCDRHARATERASRSSAEPDRALQSVKCRPSLVASTVSPRTATRSSATGSCRSTCLLLRCPQGSLVLSLVVAGVQTGGPDSRRPRRLRAARRVAADAELHAAPRGRGRGVRTPACARNGRHHRERGMAARAGRIPPNDGAFPPTRHAGSPARQTRGLRSPAGSHVEPRRRHALGTPRHPGPFVERLGSKRVRSHRWLCVTAFRAPAAWSSNPVPARSPPKPLTRTNRGSGRLPALETDRWNVLLHRGRYGDRSPS